MGEKGSGGWFAARRGVVEGSMLDLACVVGAVVIWSTSFVATKVTLAEVPPLTLGASRFALAAVLAGIVALVFGSVRVAGAADLGKFALGGLLGITLYFSLENVGVDLATASDAALVVASYPAITMLLEAGLYRKRLSVRRLFGVTLAFLGSTPCSATRLPPPRPGSGAPPAFWDARSSRLRGSCGRSTTSPLEGWLRGTPCTP